MSHRRTPFVGGNWKMNTDLASAVELADDVVSSCKGFVEKCDIAVFPPFPYLQAVGKTLGNHGILLGAQDVYHEGNGAFTGEVSAEMLVDLGVSVVIAGHSERRHVLGEQDELINQKVRAALDAAMWVILCVGEKLDEREKGKAEEVSVRQLKMGLEGVPMEQMRQVTIAYEPVWAIGTGKTATAADAQAMHLVLRREMARLYDDPIARETRIQYGGSVKGANAAELIAQADVDGFLVGGASLKSDEFGTIVGAVVAAP
ncbi:MAG TPA: triose-phosphate isomerase [Phycisphaerales bacterium]|nr:triose-phosphate isomerase [Phycisphaerales bacterium]